MTIEQDNEDQRIRDQLAPDAVMFVRGPDGTIHFATDHLPWRTVIDTRLGFMAGLDVNVDDEAGTVTITADGRTAVYLRRGVDPHGRWVCNLKRQ